MPFKFNPFTDKLDIVDVSQFTGVVETLTGNSGGAVPATGNNINIVGANTNIVVGTPGSSTLTIEASPQGFPITPYVVGPGGYAGYQTINSAYAAAIAVGAGADIFVMGGSYNENLTMVAGYNLVGYPGDQNSANSVNLTGTITYSGGGTVSVTGINLISSSAASINISGTGSDMILNNCFIRALFTDAIILTANGSTLITLNNCQGAVNGPGVSLYSFTGVGSNNILTFNNCTITNNGAATAFSNNSVGTVVLNDTFFGFGISTSGTGTLDVRNSIVNTATPAVVAIITSGTGTSLVNNSKILSGVASAISIGSGSTATVTNTEISSSNTNAITGTGTLNYGGIVFSGTSSTINTSTVNALNEAIGNVTTGTWAGTNIAVAHGGTGNSSQSAFSLVAGGTTTTGAFQAIAPVATGQVLASAGTGALPAFTATPTVTSITIGSGSALSTFVNNASWTPTLAFGGSSTGITYSFNNGTYTQIGNLVFITFQLQLSSKGAQTGNATINGLPITSGQTFSIVNYISINGVANLTLTGVPILQIGNGGTSGTVVASSNGTLTTLTNTAFANNTQLFCQGWYTSA
jgi:hypothetical protein